MFVLLPILTVMLLAGVVYHFYGLSQATAASRRQLHAAAQITSELIQRRIDGIDASLETVLLQEQLNNYYMYERAGLLDDAENNRLELERMLVRLALSDRDIQLIALYNSHGDRFVAVIDGHRTLEQRNVKGEPWFTAALVQESLDRFDEHHLIRLAHTLKSEGSQTVAVATLRYKFGPIARDAASFATQYLDDVEVDVKDSGGLTRFQLGSLPTGETTFEAQAPIKSLCAVVEVRQGATAALAMFHRAEALLLAAIGFVTLGVLIISALGTLSAMGHLRRAQLRADEANRARARSWPI